MSIPSSLLTQFRSYSYHHILVVCDNSKTAEALTASDDDGIWQHAADDATPLGRYSPKKVQNAEGSMQYCVLINGMVDASFTIPRIQWAATTTGAATPHDNNTSVALEGSMTISEPKGVVFLDQLARCCNALGANASTVVYLVKTVFIGYSYNEDTGDDVVYISDIPPLTVMLTNAAGKFTEQGGTYDLNFVAMTGGAARLPQFSRLPGTINLTAEPTLGRTLKKLEEKITEAYAPYFACVKTQVAAGMRAAGKDPTEVVNALQAVKYEITYDPAFENYTVTNQAQAGKTDPACAAPANIASTANMSIEDLVRKVLYMSKEVNNDMVKGIGSPPIKQEYKVHASVVMSETGPIVKYNVERFMSPKELMKARNIDFGDVTDFEKGTASDPMMNPVLRQSIIQFDYVYTGKNIDILEFEMTVNHGIVFMQNATSANSFKDQLDGSPPSIIVPNQYDQHQIVSAGKVAPIPVYFGAKISSPLVSNSQNSIASAQAAYTMSKHSSLEVVGGVTMKIVGNTNMLAGIANYSASTSQPVKPTSDNYPSVAHSMRGFGYNPLYAQINIKMPRNNDDLSLFGGVAGEDGSSDYAVDFWFDGYYYITSVDNIFENGEFTQDLHMIGLPKAGVLDPADDMKNGEVGEISFTQPTTDCNTGTLGCGQPATQSNPTPATAAAAPKVENSAPVGPPAPTTKADADVAVRNVTAPSDVKGWSKASPAVQNSIINAAAATGTSATTLAQMAAIESNFGANTHNPQSSAAGTFQIVRQTWNGTVNGGHVPGVPPGTSFNEAGDPDNNAAVAAVLMHNNQVSIRRACGVANASDVTPGDTYLAHFLGAGGAQAVINADNRSGGSMTVKDAYLEKFGNYNAYNIAKRSNASVINDNVTVHELRTAAAVAMANTSPLSKAIKVAGKVPVTATATKPPSAPVSTPTTAVKASEPASRARDCAADENKSATQKSCNEVTQPVDKSATSNKTAPTATTSTPYTTARDR